MDYTIDKVAEAMDFLEANGIDAIGGLTALYNIDEAGNVLDEKVASELNALEDYQLDALAKVAEYLYDEDPADVASVALELNNIAEAGY